MGLSVFKVDPDRYKKGFTQPRDNVHYYIDVLVVGANKHDIVKEFRKMVYDDNSIRYVQTMGQPQIQTSTVEIPVGPYKMRVPGLREYGDYSITMYSDADFQLMNILYRWQDALYHIPSPNIDKVDYPDFSSLTVDFILCPVDLNGNIDTSLKCWYFREAWPTSVNYGSLSYSNSDLITFDIDFAFKECERRVYDQNKSAASTPPLTPNGAMLQNTVINNSSK